MCAEDAEGGPRSPALICLLGEIASVENKVLHYVWCTQQHCHTVSYCIRVVFEATDDGMIVSVGSNTAGKARFRLAKSSSKHKEF